MTAPSTKVTVRSKADEFKTEFVERWAPELGPLAGPKFGTDRILAGTIAAAVQTPAIFSCTKQSIYLALLKVARWQLDVGEGVYLIPYKGVCTAVPSYTGLIALARRQKLVRHIEAYVVYEGERDTFDFAYGSPGYIKHKTCPAAKRGKIIYAYAIIILPGGIERWHVMPIEDIDAIRAKSQKWSPTSNPPVYDCPAWYAQKTVVRAYLNRQPKSGALAEALGADEIESPDPIAVVDETRRPFAAALPAATPQSEEAAALAAGSPEYFGGGPDTAEDTRTAEQRRNDVMEATPRKQGISPLAGAPRHEDRGDGRHNAEVVVVPSSRRTPAAREERAGETFDEGGEE